MNQIDRMLRGDLEEDFQEKVKEMLAPWAGYEPKNLVDMIWEIAETPRNE